MGKARMLGQFKPCTPNSQHYARSRKAPWQGEKKKPKPKKDNPVRLCFCDEIASLPPQKEQEVSK